MGAAAEVHRRPRARSAWRAAASVPAVVRRARSTSSGDHGSPSPRCSRTRQRRRRGCARRSSGSCTRLERLPRRPARPRGPRRPAVGDHPRAQQRVLVAREPVVLGEREAPAVVASRRARSRGRPRRRARGLRRTARPPPGPPRRPSPPSSRRESCARRKYSGASCSQVAPMPPCTEICARAAWSSAAPAATRSADAASGNSSGLSWRRPAGVVHQRAGVLEPPQHLHQLVLDRLVGADRAPEREALLGVLRPRPRARPRPRRATRRRAAPGRGTSAAADASALDVELGRRRRRRASRGRASASRRSGAPARPRAVGAGLDQHRARVAVLADRDADEQRRRLARPAPSRARRDTLPSASTGAGRRTWPKRGSAVQHGLDVARRLGRQVRRARLAGGETLERVGVRVAGRVEQERRRQVARAAAPTPARGRARRTRASLRARCRPAPPRSSAISRPGQPASQAVGHRSGSSPPSSASRAASSVEKRPSAPRAASWRNSCSSVSAKFTTPPPGSPPRAPSRAAPRTGCPCPGAARAAGRAPARRPSSAGSPRCRRRS